MKGIFNCGHTGPVQWVRPDPYGYTWCTACEWKNTGACIRYCNRAVSHLLSGSSTVFNSLGNKVGTITEYVRNEGARTPTGGKHITVRMTIRAFDGSVWYANGPKKGTTAIIMRRAS